VLVFGEQSQSRVRGASICACGHPGALGQSAGPVGCCRLHGDGARGKVQRRDAIERRGELSTVRRGGSPGRAVFIAEGKSVAVDLLRRIFRRRNSCKASHSEYFAEGNRREGGGDGDLRDPWAFSHRAKRIDDGPARLLSFSDALEERASLAGAPMTPAPWRLLAGCHHSLAARKVRRSSLNRSAPEPLERSSPAENEKRALVGVSTSGDRCRRGAAGAWCSLPGGSSRAARS
jgi:hypothetical protein